MHPMVTPRARRRFVEKKTSEFYTAFNAEINVVKKAFDAVRRAPPKSPILPKYAGTARHAMYLLRRLEATHRTASQVRWCLSPGSSAGIKIWLLHCAQVAPSSITSCCNSLLTNLYPFPLPSLQVRYMLPQVPEADEVFAAYELAHGSIEQFMHNTHAEWFGTIEPSISKELQANLMTQDKAAGGYASKNLPDIPVLQRTFSLPQQPLMA